MFIIIIKMDITIFHDLMVCILTQYGKVKS